MAAGGGFVNGDSGAKKYSGNLTWKVILACLLGAIGGLLFGYDIGISGGVTSMPNFLNKFFPSVYKKEEGIVPTNQYCTFDSQILTLFTSSLYVAALVSCFVASWLTKKIGRQWCIFYGGVIFLFGALLNFFADNILMLIFGRIFLGFGVGFQNQAVPLFLSEMAPHRYRGALNILFQLMITVGILSANLVNFGTNKIKDGAVPTLLRGWGVSLGAAAIPAVFIIFGIIVLRYFCSLTDTPSSLVNRGKIDEARRTLQRIRGTNDVDNEFNDMLDANTKQKTVESEHSWTTIFKKQYRPQLVMAIFIPFFQQFTGINVIMFYAPVLFKTLGSGNDSSLVQAVVIGVVNVLATFIAIFTVDKKGRKFLFTLGGVVMFICQITVGALIGHEFGTSRVATISQGYAYMLLGLICLYVAAFACSWGPLGWLVPSEIFPLEIRAMGQSITVAVNMLMTFLIGQIFLKALCWVKFGLFFIFAGFVVIMTLFIWTCLPETKGVPIEDMAKEWKKLRCWKQYITEESPSRVGGI